MNSNSVLQKRRHPRLKNYDYSSSGAYFITICTQNKQCVLSRIVGRGLAVMDIICAYKSLTATQCKKNGFEDKLFQTSFYEHIIRGREDYYEISKYIHENPQRWKSDKLYTEK